MTLCIERKSVTYVCTDVIKVYFSLWVFGYATDADYGLSEEDEEVGDDIIDNVANDEEEVQNDANYGLSQGYKSSPIRVDKSKTIMIEQDDEPSSKNKLSKELEEELLRKAIEDILSQEYHDEKKSERLRMEAMNVKRVYMKRKTPSVITPDVTKATPEVKDSTHEIVKDSTHETVKDVPKSSPEIPMEIPKTTTIPLRKKSIAMRSFKRIEEAITPDSTKHKIYMILLTQRN
ncbi:hypothetical protein L1987_43438 [Smallanthus sonchifolius]|uniref:Uncharacterized protein n=1 Tax=Smallanthus sonchifolius TaxID=185202 RepID=A0ACB9GMW1_9ASTR|nr:hypothetical protein L1987_43438 [Smallanthus sonchifolius]